MSDVTVQWLCLSSSLILLGVGLIEDSSSSLIFSVEMGGICKWSSGNYLSSSEIICVAPTKYLNSFKSWDTQDMKFLYPPSVRRWNKPFRLMRIVKVWVGIFWSLKYRIWTYNFCHRAGSSLFGIPTCELVLLVSMRVFSCKVI